MTAVDERVWKQLRPHDGQRNFFNSPFRFNVVPAGRRSGKTEIAKRRWIVAAGETDIEDAVFIFGAPTHKQARQIFWQDLKRMVPQQWMAGRPNETRGEILLINGAKLITVGLDVPERIEGIPGGIQGGVLDEYGNMKPEVWGQHVRPSLDTVDREGGMDFTGVPEGRNHYYELYRDAKTNPLWGTYTWHSSTVLSPEAVQEAKDELDELTFKQEYEASFVTFEGQAYYSFDEAKHCFAPLPYDPSAPLIVMLDFNRQPGIAAIGQERAWEPGMPGDVAESFTAILGEVYIPFGSNTPMVCRKILQDWGAHVGDVLLYGDSTGGRKTSQAVGGSDWDLVSDVLRPHFGSRLKERYPRANPHQRARLNAMNSRLMSTTGKIRMLVDAARCPHVVKDLEGVRLVKGGAGEIDKTTDENLTHISDGIGYYIAEKFPVRAANVTQSSSIYG